MVRESMDQDLLDNIRLLRSFEEGDDSFTLFPTPPPPPVAVKAASIRRIESQKLEQEEAECSMHPNMSDGLSRSARLTRAGPNAPGRALPPVISPSVADDRATPQPPKSLTSKTMLDTTLPTMPLSPTLIITPNSGSSVSSSAPPSAPASPVTPANGQMLPIGPLLGSSSNVSAPSASSKAPRSAAAPSPAPSQAGPLQGQKAPYRLSASKSALQAKRLALQIKELQIQQQDLLRTATSGSVPPSPITPHTPRSIASMSAAGPPPMSPLPPIPRSPLHQQQLGRTEGGNKDDNSNGEKGRTSSAGVVNDSHPHSLVGPSANNAQGGNEGRSSPSGAGASSISRAIIGNSVPSASAFALQQEAQVSRANVSSKRVISASSTSLPLEKRNTHIIAEEDEEENRKIMPLTEIDRRPRSSTQESWSGKLIGNIRSEPHGERTSYNSIASSSHMQDSPSRKGQTSASASSDFLTLDLDSGKPAPKSKDMSRSTSDTKANSGTSQGTNTTSDPLFPSSNRLNASATATAVAVAVAVAVASSSSSDGGGDDMGGRAVLVEKSDLEGVLLMSEDSTDTSFSRPHVLPGQHIRSSYQIRTRAQALSSSRLLASSGTGPLSKSLSRRDSWLNGPSVVEHDAIASGNGSRGAVTAATIFAGAGKLGGPGPMPANLPDWSEIERGGPTSLPIHQIQRDLDFSMRRLLTIQVFEELLEDPLGRHRFRDYLVSVGASTAELDMWLDLQNHVAVYQSLQSNAEALHDIYMVQGSPHRVKFPHNVHREIDVILRHKHAARPESAFSSAQQHLLEHLYNSDFQSFVKQRIIEQAEVKLGRASLKDSDGLGDCFCLTNPRLRDHPIVLASDGFEELTGYHRSQVVGRNCRFLQGPGTAPESVQRIREGLNSGDGCNELLLNYRRDGTPFYCLLCIIPLRDANGQLIYFIGGQTNVTGIFSEGKSLSFLITGDTAVERAKIDLGDIPKVSPAMQEYQQGSSGKPSEGSGSVRSSRHAAGSQSNSDKFGYHGSGGFSDPYLSKPNEFGTSASNGNGVAHLGGMFGRLFKKPSQETGFGYNPGVGGLPSQRITGTGAEALIGGTSGALQDQMAVFKCLYSRLVVLKKAKREIIFVTRDLLTYLGLPAAPGKDLYASPLIHADLLDCVSAGDKAATKALRDRIKSAIKNEESTSEVVSLKLSGGWGLLPGRSEQHLRIGSLHLTPLRERDGNCVAYAGVFGWTKTYP